MKQIAGLAFLFVMPVLAFIPACNNKNSTQPQPGEWVELINGKDFTGWKASENTATWSVTPEGYFQAVGKRSHLFYEGEELKEGFKNFEIEVQVKTFKLANSGIYFHTQYQETGWPSNGMEIQVNNTHIGEGDYIELKKMASLYGIRNVYKAFGKDGEWMTVKARVESDRVQVWVDSVKTVDYVQPANAGKRLSKGTFCLQGHDSLSKMQYRSFKVRRLPDSTGSGLTAPVLGAWHDSLIALQGRQFAFIDLNPQVEFSVQQLTDYVYSTGINAALVKNNETATELVEVKNHPLFTGIKINAVTGGSVQAPGADYIIGESSDLQTAKALLSSTKINIWSDKGNMLGSKDADELLEMAGKNNIAIEIDNIAQSPSIEVIKKAKAKGCKFSFSGLIPASNMEKSVYVLNALKEAKLTYKDLYIPGW